MPKIKALTIQEHRAGQKNLLLQHARNLILTGGVAALSFDRLAKKAKLSRPAVYEYFKSKNDLILSLIESEFPLWEKDLLKSLSEAQSPIEAIESFVRDQLVWIVEGRHKLAFIIMSSQLDEEAMSRVHQLHQGLTELLSKKLIELDVNFPEEYLTMILGVINASAYGLAKSKAAHDVIETAVSFVIAGIRGARSTDSTLK